MLANVYLLLRSAARAFHQGKNQRAFFVDQAAKHVAVARGPSFDSVYRGGHMSASTFGEILDRGGSFANDDWREFAPEIQYPFADEFYVFEADPQTELSSDEVNAAYLESKRRRKTELRVPLNYRFSRLLYAAAFEPNEPLFPAERAFYRTVEQAAPVREGRLRG